MTASLTLTLSDLPTRQVGRIVRVGGATEPNPSSPDYGESLPLQARLFDLGFEEGAKVEVRHRGPFGGPLAVQVDDRLIAIRPRDAAVIEVTPDSSSGGMVA